MLFPSSPNAKKFKQYLEERPWGEVRCAINEEVLPRPSDCISWTLRFSDGRKLQLKLSAAEVHSDLSYYGDVVNRIEHWLAQDDPKNAEIYL